MRVRECLMMIVFVVGAIGLLRAWVYTSESARQPSDGIDVQTALLRIDDRLGELGRLVARLDAREAIRREKAPSQSGSVRNRQHVVARVDSTRTVAKVWKRTDGGLNDADRAILSGLLFNADSVFEWGVGESTYMAVATNVSRYSGADGSIDWLKKVRDAVPSHYRLIWLDIGKTGKWGMPEDEASRVKWPFYSTAPLAAETEPFDVYFVDGRFRVACALSVLLHASRLNKPADQFVVVIHDFAYRTGPYADIKKVARPVAGCCNEEAPSKDALLVVLRRREDASDDDILALWHKWKYEKL